MGLGCLGRELKQRFGHLLEQVCKSEGLKMLLLFRQIQRGGRVVVVVVVSRRVSTSAFPAAFFHIVI